MIFDEQIARKPDHYPWTQDFIESMWNSHWTPTEFNFQSDLQDFKTNLTIEDQEIVKKALSAIGQIEIAVKKFWSRLGDNLPHPSLNDLGLTMANIEVIHNKAYEKLIEVLNLDEIFEENLKLDIIKGRVNYLKKYNEKNYSNQRKQYIYSLILFTLFVENVSLFSQFYIILWYNKFRNVLKDTAQQVAYTKIEETLHAEVGIKIINTMREKHECSELFDQELEKKIISEAHDAFKAESKIIDWILGDFNEESLNKEILKEYVKNRINDSLIRIGFTAIFQIDSSLISQTEWMNEEVIGGIKTDFFHQRPTDYLKTHTSFDAADWFVSAK